MAYHSSSCQNKGPTIMQFVSKFPIAILAFAATQTVWSQSPRPTRPLEDFRIVTGTADDPVTFGNRTPSRNNQAIHQVNVNGGGSNIAGDAANEPSMCIDPTNPNRIAVGWRQFDTIASNFRQAGYGYSADGGNSWSFPGRIEPGIFRSDPVLESTANGTFYYLSLKQTFYCDMFASNTGGASYALTGPAVGGDKQWFVIDRTANPSQGYMYQIWSTAGNNYSGRQFSRTTNGGSTWLTPINIPNSPIWGTLDVAANSDVFVCGSNGGSSYYVTRSQNAKNSAVTPTFNQTRTVSLGGSAAIQIAVNPEGLGGQAWISCDKSSGSTAGYIYLLSSVARNGSNPLDVMFTRSTDGGNTWATAQRINDDAANQGHYHWFGTLSTAPNGRIDTFWMDSREDPAHSQSHLRYRYSVDGGTTWSISVPLTNSFDPLVGFPQQNKIGDYMQSVSLNSHVGLAFCATFNGEEDVYYTQVTNRLRPVVVQVALQNYIPSSEDTQVTLDLRNGSNQVVHSQTLPLDLNGQAYMSVPTSVADGSYTVTAKASHWLRKASGTVAVSGVGVQTVTSLSLINGDIDGNNIINTDDYLVLSQAFDTGPGDPDWVADADLDGSAHVTTDDYLIFSANFDLIGD